jgi:hypothetical protein
VGEFLRDALPAPLDFYEAEGLTLTGHGKWRNARCPLHGGTSLRINLQSGAFCCMGGCEFRGGDVIAFLMLRDGLTFVAACKRLGAWVESRRGPRHQASAPALSARDRLELLAGHTHAAWVIACDMRAGKPISDADFSLLTDAVRAIDSMRWHN